jgi:chitodextrinase
MTVVRRPRALLVGLIGCLAAVFLAGSFRVAADVSLVAAYPFSAGAGSDLADASGNNLTGTIVGATWTTAGKHGNALSFDGVSTYVDLGNPASLQLSGSATWSAWVYATAIPMNDGQIIAKADPYGWQLKTSPDSGVDAFAIRVTGPGNVSAQRNSVTVRQLHTWYHVAGVYNSTAQTLDIYVNGVLDNGFLKNTVPTSIVASSANVTIGRRGGGHGWHFAGMIDDVRIYNRPLSAEEIVADMNTPVDGAADTEAPSAPGPPVTSGVSSAQITVTWPAATDNVAVTTYTLERCAGVGCSTFAAIATQAGLSFTDTGLAPLTTYSYRVRATDAASNVSAYSAVATTATSAAPDTQAPTAPGTPVTSGVTSTQVTVTWPAATDNIGVTGYALERCAGVGCVTFAPIATQSGLSFGDTGLTPSTSYSYRVQATDAAGHVSAYSAVATTATSAAPDTQAPTAPGTPVTSGVTSTQLTVTWSPSTDNVGVTNYTLERCAGVGCVTFAPIATQSGLSFGDTGLTPSTSYSYRVQATDAAGNVSAYSAVATTATSAAPDTQAPTAPGTPSTSGVTSTQITVTWSASTDNVGVTNYTLERCAGVGCVSYAPIATQSGLSFSDTGLTPSTSYSYRVQATDAAGNVSAYSGIATAVTDAPLDTQAPTAPGTPVTSGVSSTQITVTWAAATDDVAVSTYTVERCASIGCSDFAAIATQPGVSVTDTGLTSSTSYSYRVKATDAAGNTSAYSPVATTTTLTVTGGLRVEYTFSEGSGTTVADTSGSGVTGTLNGAAWTTAGKHGNAVALDGVSAHVDLGNPAGLQLSGSATWSAWVYATAAPMNDGQIMAKADPYGWQLKTSPDSGVDAFAIRVTGPGNVSAQRNSVTVRQLHTWYHVAGVYNSTAQTLDIYVNGVLDNGFLKNTVPASIVASSANVTIGRRGGGHGWHFAGIIDDVRIYDRALSAGEIVADMNAPADGDTLAPSAPGTPVTSGVSSTQMTISWPAATDNIGVTSYTLERCAGVACGSFAPIVTQAGLSFADTGLAPATSYSYRVRATDAAGNTSAYSTIATAATSAAPDTQSPTAPGVPVASGVTATQITVTWGASTDNVGVTSYTLERCAGIGCSSFAAIATQAGLSFTDTGLTPSSSYSYRVTATDAAGNASAYSAIATAVTSGTPDTEAPTAPGSPATSGVSSTQITVTWSGSTDNIGVTNYTLERCEGAGCTTFAPIATQPGLSFADSGLTPSTSYSYRVKALDGAANESAYSPTASATTALLTSGLVAEYTLSEGTGTSTSDTSSSGNTGTLIGTTWTTLGRHGHALVFDGSSAFVDLGNPAALQLNSSATWTAWINASAAPPDDGQIIAKSDSNGGWQLKTTPDSGVETFAIRITGPGDQSAQRHSLTVRQLNTWYHVAGVYDASAQTLDIYVNGVLDNGILSDAVPASQIIAPVNVTIGQRSGGWHFAGVIDDVRVYNRALSASEIFTDMNTPPEGPDTQAPTVPGTPAPTVISSTQVRLTWTTATDNFGVTGYVLERCQGAGCADFAPIATPSAASFVDTGLSAATTYVYRVRATDAAGNLSDHSGEASATTSVPGTAPPVFVAEAHSATDGCCGLEYNNTTLTVNVTGSNNILIAAWHAEWDGTFGEVPFPPDPGAWSVTNNGVPGTVLLETNGYTGADGNRRFRIYYWLNPPQGINTVRVSNPNMGPNELSVAALLFTNVNQINPIGDVVLDTSMTPRSAESETVTTTPQDLVVHVIADAVYLRGNLGAGETEIVRVNDGAHQASGDASLLISTKPGQVPATTVSSSGWWLPRILSGVAIVLHGAPN